MRRDPIITVIRIILAAHTGRRIRSRDIDVVHDHDDQYAVRVHRKRGAADEFLVDFAPWRRRGGTDVVGADVAEVEFTSWPPTRTHGRA